MGAALRLPRGSCTAQHEHRLCSPQVSLITLLMLPAILSPTILCSTGVGLRLRPRLPVGSPFGSSLRATLQTSSLLRRLVPASDRIEFTLAPLRVTVVTDWQFLPLCSPRRVATTQLRFRSLAPFSGPEKADFHRSAYAPSQAHGRMRCRASQISPRYPRAHVPGRVNPRRPPVLRHSLPRVQARR